MSLIRFSSNAAGSGIFTLASPNSNTDRTITLPDSNGTVALSGTGQTIVSSTLSDGTNSTSTTNAIQGSAKAWVNFDGGTVAIRASFNVSSITDNAVGEYTVNFTNALPDANASAVVTSKPMNTGVAIATACLGYYNTITNPITTTSVRVLCMASTGDVADIPFINVAIFR